jgi:hypothetical protein
MWDVLRPATVQACSMHDRTVLNRVEALVEEEHALQRKKAGDATDIPALERDRDRLRSGSVELDRCWTCCANDAPVVRPGWSVGCRREEVSVAGQVADERGADGVAAAGRR